MLYQIKDNLLQVHVFTYSLFKYFIKLFSSSTRSNLGYNLVMFINTHNRLSSLLYFIINICYKTEVELHPSPCNSILNSGKDRQLLKVINNRSQNNFSIGLPIPGKSKALNFYFY